MANIKVIYEVISCYYSRLLKVLINTEEQEIVDKNMLINHDLKYLTYSTLSGIQPMSFWSKFFFVLINLLHLKRGNEAWKAARTCL